MIQYHFPTVLFFGSDSLIDLNPAIQKKGLKSLLMVTDPGLVHIGLADFVKDTLTSSRLNIDIFDGVHPNPLEEDVTLGVKAYESGDYGGIIALGGGSAIDVAKTIRFMTVHEPPLSQYDDAVGGDTKIINPMPPLFAIPTTAGTGSEVGRSSVITIKETGKKTIFFHPGLIPDIAVLDPKLTVDLPPHITAATGMDAFTHCMEAYLVDSYHPMADSIAIEGMKMIVANLPKVMENPNNLESRGQMLLSATMGATAFQKGLGMIHSMAHPLSAKFNIHHGLANALLIKFCLEFTIDKAIRTENKALQKKLNDIGNILSSNTLSNIYDIPYIIESFIHSISIALGLDKYGVQAEDVAELGQLAFDDSCHDTHPFAVNQDNFHAVYTRAL